MQTLDIDGKEVVIVWMPYCWGFKGLSTGPSVNHLTIDALDPVAGTQETKACLVNVVKVRDAVFTSPGPRGRRA
jgi:formate dehydrogenase major subunit